MGKVSLIRILTFAAVIAGMVGVSDLLGQREIIFPEIAALMTGLVLSARSSRLLGVVKK